MLVVLSPVLDWSGFARGLLSSAQEVSAEIFRWIQPAR
jgi:hypothetical protein